MTELLQAELAVFAEVGKEQRDHSIYEALGEVVLGEEVIFQDRDDHEEFRYFRSQRSPVEEEMVGYTERLLLAFEPYKNTVVEIKEQLEAGVDPHDIDGYLASGAESRVFSINDQDGNSLALRISNFGKADHINYYLKGPFATRNVSNTETLKAASFEMGATIAEMLPGKPLDRYTTDEIVKIPEKHWRQLAKLQVELKNNGADPDGNQGNLIYDFEDGFSYVDLGATRNIDDRVEPPPLFNTATSQLFSSYGWREQVSRIMNIGDAEIAKQCIADLLPVARKWQIYSAEEGGKDFSEKEDIYIRETIIELERIMEQLSSPATLVEDNIAREEKRMEAYRVRLNQAEKDGNSFPGVDYFELHVQRTEDRLKRGRYLTVFPYGKRLVTRNDSIGE